MVSSTKPVEETGCLRYPCTGEDLGFLESGFICIRCGGSLC